MDSELRIALMKCLERQRKETTRKTLSRQGNLDKFLKLSPEYYDLLVQESGYLILKCLDVEEKKFFYRNLSGESIKRILEEAPEEFKDIPDYRLNEFFADEENEEFLTKELFHSLVTVSDKIEFIHLVSQTDTLERTDLLVQWWIHGDGRKELFDFMEDISDYPGVKESEEFIYSSILARQSSEVLAQGINLYPDKIKVINKLLSKLSEYHMKFVEVLENLEITALENIVETCDLDILKQLKGYGACEIAKCDHILYNRANEAGKLYDLFTSGELAYLYSEFTFKEKKDILIALFKNYEESQIWQFYQELPEKEMNEFLGILVEVSLSLDGEKINWWAKKLLEKRIQDCQNEESSTLIPELLLQKMQETEKET